MIANKLTAIYEIIEKGQPEDAKFLEIFFKNHRHTIQKSVNKVSIWKQL